MLKGSCANILRIRQCTTKIGYKTRHKATNQNCSYSKRAGPIFSKFVSNLLMQNIALFLWIKRTLSYGYAHLALLAPYYGTPSLSLGRQTPQRLNKIVSNGFSTLLRAQLIRRKDGHRSLKKSLVVPRNSYFEARAIL